ncbi:hypothetical protein SASPL_115242 [Salvia splendens]|uniref:THO complex subunit 1 n=1 Tax=Salvia splendens TaxID=180675 RepID=A0A8X8Y669_SALSN|nr:hypothetical protein SASPL_115242 [Salvia splendens]
MVIAPLHSHLLTFWRLFIFKLIYTDWFMCAPGFIQEGNSASRAASRFRSPDCAASYKTPGSKQKYINLNVKQVKLVQDENMLLENILRTLLQELVSDAVQSGEAIMLFGQSIADEDARPGQIPRLLDIVLYLCEKEHIEGGMIFQLLEDLTEMSTMRNCEDIFGYIESKQDILGKPELFARGKLVMLRTCNQLLRRLSKANDVVFCGRIIMFLAHFFPLSERSAVNIKGVFNTSNETKYEKEAPESSSIDFNFYKTFWSLQESFSNPASLASTVTKWQKFTSSLMVVLNTFEAQPLRDEDGSAINLEDEASNFSIKYLTSSNLMGLEAPGKTDKDLPTDTTKEEIKNCEERVKKLLEMTPPRGKEFLHSIEHILERERNWVWWKRDGCSAFEKPPVEKKPAQDGGRKRRPRWRLGNKELSQLWKWADQNPNALTDPQRVRTPAIMDYWKPLAEDVYCWKGLRFSARQDLEGFSRFTEHGIEGVVPLELLPLEVRSKYQAKPGDRTKRAKKEETKGSTQQVEDTQIATPASETEMDGGRNDGEGATGDGSSVSGEGDENQKLNSDTDGGLEAGQIEGDTDLDVVA